MSIPVIGFAAYSGTGKTTLIEQLVYRLKAKGYRVAVIKHDAHHFEIDKEGKDSWRYTHAGADMMLLSSPQKTALIEQRKLTLSELIAMVHDVDLILVEGYKQEKIPRIGINRIATGKGFPHDPSEYIAVVTDDPTVKDAPIPVFALDDSEGICTFLLQYSRLA